MSNVDIEAPSPIVLPTMLRQRSASFIELSDDAAKTLGIVGTVIGDDDDGAKVLAQRIEAGEVAVVLAELEAVGSLPLFKLIFDHLSSYGRMDVFNSLSPELRCGTFSFMRPSEKSMIIRDASIGDAEAYVLALPPAERLEAIQVISTIEKVLHVLTADEKTACDLRRKYPKDSVGSLMHRIPDGMTLLSSLTVGEAIREISLASYRVSDPRRSGGIFLVRDGENRLLGYTEAITLLKMNAGVAPADALSRTDGYSVKALGAGVADGSSIKALGVGVANGSSIKALGAGVADGSSIKALGAGAAVAEAVAAALAVTPRAGPKQNPADYLLLSVLQPIVHVLRVDDNTDELLRQQMIATVPLLPVVDDAGILMGVIRASDAVQLMQARISYLSSGDGDSYSKSSVLFLVKKRVVWLLILAALNFGVRIWGECTLHR
jgi:Mg/Co/Ni transporter MgtE